MATKTISIETDEIIEILKNHFELDDTATENVVFHNVPVKNSVRNETTPELLRIDFKTKTQ